MAIGRIVISENEISTRIKDLGKVITDDYQGKTPVFVGILNGCFMFLSDLMKSVALPCSIDFITLSSYKNRTESDGEVDMLKELSMDIDGRDVIIVDDILDTGHTLAFLKEQLKKRNPASIKAAVLLDKRMRREEDIEADYVGFTSPDEYVVGYGMDYAGRYRNLPYIAVL